MAKITGIEHNGSIISLWINDEGVERMYHMDTRPGEQVLENLQEDANIMAFEHGHKQGFIGYLDIEFEVESWGGLISLAPVGYDIVAHEAAMLAAPASTSARSH